jgi:hypothetical protein
MLASHVSNLFVPEELRLGELMKRRSAMLDEEEAHWILKRKVIYLKEGENNSKFFHNFSNQRQIHNTIFEIKVTNGISVSSFDGITNVGIGYFSSILNKPSEGSISETLNVINIFT